MESVESIESSKACRLRWIRAIWRRFDLGLKVIAVVLMLVAGLHRLGTQSARLLWHTSKDAAIDLQYRFVEMQSWFSGQTVYHEIDTAVYPPASYMMLWPIFGWSTLVATKWMFAFSCFASLAGLVWLFSMEGGAKSRLEYALLMLIPVTTYATGITIGNGQLDIYVIFGLVAAFTLLSRRRCRWYEDVLVALCMLMALVKPNLAAPFFWIVMFVPGRIRPAVFTVVGYAVLSLGASAFQEGGFMSLHQQWIDRALTGAVWGATHHVASFGGTINSYGSINNVLGKFGLSHWSNFVSLCILFIVGGWVYRQRRGDIWLLVGVVAIVARVWTYHRIYDDMIMVIPALVLFRIAKRSSVETISLVSGLMVAIVIASMIVPARLLSFPAPWPHLFIALQMMVWAIVMVFLVYLVWWDRRGEGRAHALKLFEPTKLGNT